MYHPQDKNPDNVTFVKNYAADYADLFKTQKQVNQQQYVQYEQARLEPVLKQRREMSLKQAHVRFGVLNTNKDDKIILKEYQEISIKPLINLIKIRMVLLLPKMPRTKPPQQVHTMALK